MSAKPVKVLYIAGDGRSGSTILERVLGRMDDFAAAGELRFIWDRGVSANQLCGCGKRFNDCGFWGAALDEAFNGRSNIDINYILSLKNSLDRIRFIPLIMLAEKTGAALKRAEEYSDLFMRLYKALQKLTGCSVIIDSSKHPALLYMISRNIGDQFRVYNLHLVRDSRAVAYSWMKKKLRPEVVDDTEYMPVFGPGKSAVNWLAMNLAAEARKTRYSGYMRLRYEDFAREPVAAVRSILEMLGVANADIPHLRGAEVALDDCAHTVSGNPVRFQSGTMRITPDEEWMDKMRPWDMRVTTALTYPLLRRYGYVSRK